MSQAHVIEISLALALGQLLLADVLDRHHSRECREGLADEFAVQAQGLLNLHRLGVGALGCSQADRVRTHHSPQ
jgi:hypothetical protein